MVENMSTKLPFQQKANLFLAYNDLIYAYENNIDAIFGNVKQSDGVVFNSKWNWKLHFRNTVHHQGPFVKNELLKKYFFDLKYQ